MRLFCRIPLMAYWLMALVFALVGGAHADEHPSLKGKNDLLCDVVVKDNWAGFQVVLKRHSITTGDALEHMRCNFRDEDGRSRTNNIFFVVAIYKGKSGTFAWDIITYLEENNETDLLRSMLIGLEIKEDIFGEIDDAMRVSKNNDRLVEELTEMKRALCLTIRKHKIEDLKPVYMQNCVK